MVYRAVKDINSNDVIAIGRDEQQGGVDYHGIGVWCDFTFTEIPEIPQDTQNFLQVTTLPAEGEPRKELNINLLYVDGQTIKAKDMAAIEASLENIPAE